VVRAALTRAIVFAVAWWALTGGEGWLFGAATVVVTTAASLALLPPFGRHLRPAGVARFAWFFARESLRGGIDVGLRALAARPGTRTRGTFLTHRTSLAAGVPRSLFVGTIGLLPGTVAVEADGADVRIHVLDRELVRPELVAALERRVANVFSEPARR
jgi:multicomponent Na+:H+ antiporter subunit E